MFSEWYRWGLRSSGIWRRVTGSSVPSVVMVSSMSSPEKTRTPRLCSEHLSKNHSILLSTRRSNSFWRRTEFLTDGNRAVRHSNIGVGESWARLATSGVHAIMSVFGYRAAIITVILCVHGDACFLFTLSTQFICPKFRIMFPQNRTTIVDIRWWARYTVRLAADPCNYLLGCRV
jgi:hypothetical protein